MLWLILLLENKETCLVRAAANDQVDVQGLPLTGCCVWRAGPISYWQLMESRGSMPCPGNTEERALVVG